MPQIQSAKALVRAHYAALDAATPETVPDILSQRMHPEATWRGVHPFEVVKGPGAAARVFWIPLLQSLKYIQRREDVFFAGTSSTGDETGIWTASMGHLMALFDAPFLGIPPTRRICMLRYAEFNHVKDNRIVETALFCDLPHLMAQAGISPFPGQTAAHLVQPGPRTHDGLLMDVQPAADGERTLALIERMIGSIDVANAKPAARTPKEELQENWHDDMLWWGPEGIGATYTIERYIEQHQRPFRQKMSDRVFNGHLCRIAEGHYGGFFGWPNLSLTNDGGFLGVPPSDTRADMRVVDIYRREGDKLAENWVFIDMLHFLKMQGIDVLGDLSAR